jgi:capsular exopolysaccharide synthesis family protein
MNEPNDNTEFSPKGLGGALVRRGRDPSEFGDHALAPVGPQAPYGEGDAQPRQWPLSRILRFKWTMILTFVLVAAPAIAAVWLLVVPKYTAKAEVRVRPIIPHLVFKTDDNGMIPLYTSYMNTQVSIIRSPGVLGRVLDQKDVQETQWYKEPETSPFKPLLTPVERLRADLSASPRGQTELVDVSMTALKSSDAATIVNAVLDQYIVYVRERSDETSDLMYKKLTEEYDSLRSEIEGREKVIAKLRKELGTGTPDELVSQMRIRLDQANAKLETAREEIATATWLEKDLAELLKRYTEPAPQPETEPAAAPPLPVEQQPKYETDEMWRRFYFDVTAVKSQVELEREHLKESHPRMLELRKRVEVAEALLRQREAQLDEQWRTRPQPPVSTAPLMVAASAAPAGAPAAPAVRPELEIIKELDSTQRRAKLLKYQEQLLADDIKKQQPNFEDVFDKAQLLAKESETVKHKRELYEAVRTRLDQKEMERNVPGSVEVLTRASAPSEPSNDRRLLLTAMALAGAAGAALALGYLRAGTSQAIHEPDDFAHAARAPFLGQLPLVPAKAYASPEDSPLLGECIRMVRTALLQRLNGHDGNVVQVTSAEPGAGKSTVATLLGKSLAQCGKKVLLVDADLRNPALSERFKVATEPGFIGSLTGQAEDAQAILATDTPLLSVLPAGKPRNGADAELVANGTFAACLDRWRRQFDIVLLDGSPLLPVADARILAQKADGTILVVRGRSTRRSDVFEALSYLQVSGGTLLGLVFIGSGGRRGYGSGYYYSHNGYASEPQHDQRGQ